MKQHIRIVLSDKEMNDIANAFHACDKEITMDISGGNVVLHIERDDYELE